MASKRVTGRALPEADEEEEDEEDEEDLASVMDSSSTSMQKRKI